ncbi:hypothetical protein [Desulfoluna spongiiphila]|uniref:Outer membrane lipoprotein-sorting protein n=1 Tax=Desulfoluna spongiiphila TaxID=419481 RepID=A0A1G5HBU8_9BACT|nr:hypothetical protein [Desulfoluna spongiiphila]SCY61246.1 hypothetical protein SAMN05216233_11380 [Desulfoluna spongiiphila]
MTQVTHRRVLSFVLLFLLACAGSAEAYLLSSSQITRQMVKKLGKPVTATLQQKELFFRSAATEASEEENLVFDEVVTLSVPDRFHSVVTAGQKKVEQFSTFDTWFRVVDGVLDKGPERAADRYRDPLQFRRDSLMAKRLTEAGVDLSVTSLNRHAGRIAWVMGAKSTDGSVRPQFWVDKESFLPMRWILFEKEGAHRVEIWYHDWFKQGKAMYPARIEFYADGRLFREIRVKGVSAGKSMAAKLFEPARYAEKKKELPREETATPEATEKQRQMEELERILSNDPLAF